jgi:hypothetical protein
MQSSLLDAKKSLEAHKILSCGVTTYMKYFIRIRKLINNNTYSTKTIAFYKQKRLK